MRYVSTREKAPACTLDQALVAGLAPDGGLYVPQTLPRFQLADFNGCNDVASVSARLLAPFFAGSSLQSSLNDICAEALDIPAPLRELEVEHAWLLELFHGPSAAFKDFGARFLARALARLREKSAPVRTILVATSGDTGAAVAAAFHRVGGFRVLILYPDGRVSARQAQQLGCFGDNVQALCVQGNFDDCQQLVKRALNDSKLCAQVPMSSANSISLGRLLPQMGYFAHAALSHRREHERAAGFIIPTGNLGNALACLLARHCGLPIGDVVLATNANPTLTEYFDGGEYTPRASIATLANAMDVGAPSNFERLRWLLPHPQRMREAVSAVRVDDDAIRATIRASHSRYGSVVCPHTATALHAMEQMRARPNDAANDWICAATAHPAKFDDIIEPLIGKPVESPPALAALLHRPSEAKPIRADYSALCAQLLP